jgi:ribosomal-protein-alanine N-acetyltransferase
VRIVAATADHLDAIDEIERHSFPNPWPRATFEAELANEIARIDVLLDPRDRVLGFNNYWLVASEVHILAIATHPDRRRGGIGRALLEHAFITGRACACELATLEVRRGNLPAIALYERCGFKQTHVRARYYQDNDEDALVMLVNL